MGDQSCKSKKDKTMQWPREKEQKDDDLQMIYKTLHRKPKIEQHESH